MSQNLLQTIVEFFHILQIPVSNCDQLYNGYALLKFVSLIQNTSTISNAATQNRNIEQKQIENGHNLQSVVNIIKKLSEIDKEGDEVSIKIEDIWVMKKEQELTMLFKKCLTLATKATNNKYFISKVLELPEQSQLKLVNILKQQQQYSFLYQSPVSINKNITNNDSLDSCCSSKIDSNKIKATDLIDRIYEVEQENDKLIQHINKYKCEYKQISQQNAQQKVLISELQAQVQTYKAQLLQAQELLIKTTNFVQDDIPQNQYGFDVKEYNQTIKHYQEQAEFIQIKYEAERNLMNNKMKELQEQIDNITAELNKQRDQVNYWQKEFQTFKLRCEGYDSKMKDLREAHDKLSSLLKQSQQCSTTLKFQLSYKNAQLEQLKQVLQTPQIYPCSSKQGNNLKSPRMLANQFSISTLSPRSSSIKIDSEEIEKLKMEISELERENDKLAKMKIKNKELEYQRNKLTKILRDYESARGQENQIITGCLYELHIKNINTNKSVFSTSTLPDQNSTYS